MQKRISWQLFSNQERNDIIAAIKEVISKNEGYITHFQFYSDLAMMLALEIKEGNVMKLYLDFKDILTISDLDEAGFNNQSTKDCAITLNISFGQGSGNLKVEVPAVPG